jgi:nucleotide-binding universal stress UspA family protein
MRTILVPVGGGDSDAIVMNTAFAIASPLRAHLDFLHVHVSADEAARHTPHIEFARGPALHNAFVELERESVTRSTQANRHVVEFCSKSGISLNATSHRGDEITAGWREDEGEGFERILFHARHHDLIVMARHKKSDGLTPDRLSRLLLESGRPLVIVPPNAPMWAMDSVVVCWRESADAARALGAAKPLLARARKVHFIAVREAAADPTEGLNEIVRQIALSGIVAEAAVIRANGRSIAQTLLAAAYERGAGLMVMGGYGHSPARQMLFGGCTEAILDNADTSVFIAH